MISGKDLYDILAAAVPMYVAVGLAFAAVRWWKIFTPQQCAGINVFLSSFAIPFLAFDCVSSYNVYDINFRLIGADALQKFLVLAALFLSKILIKSFSFEQVITYFQISTIPNTLVMGVPLLKAMYGGNTSDLLVQLVVAQGVIWFGFSQCLYEIRAAMLLVAEQHSKNDAFIASVQDHQLEVVSSKDCEPLESTTNERNNNERLHLFVRNPSSLSMASRESSLDSIKEQSPQASSVFGHDLPLQPSKLAESRSDPMVPMLFRSSSTPCSISGKHHRYSNWIRGGNKSFEIKIIHDSSHDSVHRETTPSRGAKEQDLGFGSRLEKEFVKNSIVTEDSKEGDEQVKKPQLADIVMTIQLIITMTAKQLVRNQIIYASLLGLVWALISFRYHIEMPSIVKGSITIISTSAGGMAMFSLGIFVGLQPKVITCGKLDVILTTVFRFVVAPAVMAATSAALGLRGVVLEASIVQAALPAAVVCFVWAKQYNVYPEIMSTSVILSMLLFLPITILYYVLMSLI